MWKISPILTLLAKDDHFEDDHCNWGDATICLARDDMNPATTFLPESNGEKRYHKFIIIYSILDCLT